MGVDVVNAMVLLANFVVVPALAYGSQLALGALGITLVYGILRFANFSHGDLMAFGTMVVILLTWQLQAWNIGLGLLPTALLALPLGIAATIAVGLAADRAVFRFYRLRRSAPVVLAIASVGVMFVLNGVVRVVIGPDDRSFSDGARYLINAREFKSLTGLAEGLTIRTSQVLTLALAVIAVAALFWFLRRTRAGKAMRAMADSPDLARLTGIDTERLAHGGRNHDAAPAADRRGMPFGKLCQCLIFCHIYKLWQNKALVNRLCCAYRNTRTSTSSGRSRHARSAV